PLAEAEVEYADHSSPSIYVEFPLAEGAEGDLAARVPALTGRQVSVLIWTTTPWTIPSNLAIAFHPEFDYAAYDVDGRAVIVAEALASRVGQAVGRDFGRPIARMKGAELEKIRFRHPLYARDSLGRGGAPRARPALASRIVFAPVPALLAVSQPGDFPGDLAMVHPVG